MALLTLSGMAWIGAHYFFRPLTQFGETISPIEPWSMKLHGAAAMAGWFFFGSLLNGHIRGALRIKRNLASGWMMIALISLLTLSGYGLYYLAAESSRPFWSVIHWTIGCTLALGLAMHITLGRRKPV